MRTAAIPALVSAALVIACEPESAPVEVNLQAMSFANSEWSAPVNLGAPINTAANEQGPSLANDGLMSMTTGIVALSPCLVPSARVDRGVSSSGRVLGTGSISK